MAQLCVWNKIRTKQGLVLGALGFQCMRPCSFSKQNSLIIPLRPKFAPNSDSLWVHWLFNVRVFSKWASYEKMIFFLSKLASSVSRLQAIFSSIFQAYTKPYSFCGWMKQIICQIRCDLSTTWKKLLDGGSNTFVFTGNILKWLRNLKTKYLIWSLYSCRYIFELSVT